MFNIYRNQIVEMTLMLYNDIIINISNYLTDKDKISLLSVTILFHGMKNKIAYHDQTKLI